MERHGGDPRGKVLDASWEAQYLALAAKHLGRDPYEMRNAHRRVVFCPSCGRRRVRGDDELFCDGGRRALADSIANAADREKAISDALVALAVEWPHDRVPWMRSELPPPPRPAAYRTFLYAAANWCHERELEHLDAIVVSNGGKLERRVLGG